MSLRSIVPSIVVSGIQPIMPTVTFATAPYSPLIPPPLNKLPYYIVHDPTLPSRMMQSLIQYLDESPASSKAPSPYLRSRLEFLEQSVSFEVLGDEASTTRLFGKLFDVVTPAVKEIDQNESYPSIYKQTRQFSQTPDALIRRHRTADPTLHWEDKSSKVFKHHAPGILAMGQQLQEDGRQGSYLYLNQVETKHRSIIFKIGVSMLANDNLIPYAILFGADQFMVFSLFINEDTLGGPRYGLLCSDILATSCPVCPIIPLTIFTLLGRERHAELEKSSLPIPPISDPPVIQKVSSTTRFQISRFSEQPKAQQTSELLNTNQLFLTFNLPDVEPELLFVLSRISTNGEPLSPTLSTRPLTPPSVPWSEVQIITQDSRSQLGLIASSEHDTLYPSIKDPVPIHSPTVKPGLSLIKFLGHGASGSAFYADAGYAVKLAMWKEGKEMVRHEASVYETLLPLQGVCVPKFFGLFASEQIEVIVLEFMGRSLDSIEELNVEQRECLLVKLSKIHKMGVKQGDLRPENVAINDNLEPYFLDFTHGWLHECEGPSCDELVSARKFLLLDT